MRTFAIAILAAVASAKVCPPHCPDFEMNGASAIEITELIDGFLIGALDTEHVENLDTCIKDFNPMVIDMTKAVNDFEDGSF